MKLVVITRPDFFEGETDIVNDLFRYGAAASEEAKGIGRRVVSMAARH